jgi:hypothetical protein
MTSELKAEVQNILKSLDNQGRWISIYRGERLIGQAKFKLNTPYLASSVFSQKLETLSSYLMGTR